MALVTCSPVPRACEERASSDPTLRPVKTVYGGGGRAAGADSRGPAGGRRARALAALRQAGELALSVLRMLAALVLGVALAPAIAPAIFIRLPDCLLVRWLERVAVRASSVVARVAGVRADFGTKCDVWPDPDGACSVAWLPPPIVRAWESPLNRGRIVKTFDQPGRWMSDAELHLLRETLLVVARNSMDVVPYHRLFSAPDIRAVFSNRIVSVAFDADAEPIGFTAMVYLPYPGDIIFHLGLTMISFKARRTRLQSPLFVKCLSHSIFNQCRMSFLVTNIAASPAGVGSVCDYFLDAYPHYLGETECEPIHLSVAQHVLTYFRHEFGCSENAVFDPTTFVVRGSNEPDGGGSSSFIKEDGKPVSQHKNPRCNEFVVRTIDLTAGDELFQVARFDYVRALWAYFVVSFATKPRGPRSGVRANSDRPLKN